MAPLNGSAWSVGNRTFSTRITTKNIKKREGRIALEHDLYLKSVPVYLQLKDNFSVTLKQNETLREDLKTEFKRQENKSRKLSFHVPFAYSIQHYDPSKKWKKKRCRIAEDSLLIIRVTDATYNRDIQLLSYIIRKSPNVVISKYQKTIDRCIERLADLGFPREYAIAKFETDILRELTLGWTIWQISR